MKSGHGLVAGPHEVSFGSMARQVSDMADPDANWFTLFGGQDGWLGSAAFADQVPLWRERRGIRMPLRPADGRGGVPRVTEPESRGRREVRGSAPMVPLRRHAAAARRHGAAAARGGAAGPGGDPGRAAAAAAAPRRPHALRPRRMASARSATSRDYQARVPLRRYEDFWRDWWQPAFPRLDDVTWPGRVPYFALSSGTTSGTTKYIPVTRPMVRANRRAALDVLAWHLRHHPRSRVFGGLSFMLGGSTALDRVAPGVRQGDLSGIAAAEVPRLLAPWGFPPRDLALIADWDRKLDALAERTPAACGADAVGHAVLAAGAAATAGGAAWHAAAAGAGAAGAWRRRLGALSRPPRALPAAGLRDAGGLSGQRGLLRDCRPRRGRGAAAAAGPRRASGNSSPWASWTAPNPTRHWAATIETGLDYAVIVTSCAGLWSYVLGDTVRFLDRAPPRLLVTGRTSYSLSAFGEHLLGRGDRAGAAGRGARAANGHRRIHRRAGIRCDARAPSLAGGAGGGGRPGPGRAPRAGAGCGAGPGERRLRRASPRRADGPAGGGAAAARRLRPVDAGRGQARRASTRCPGCWPIRRASRRRRRVFSVSPCRPRPAPAPRRC